MYTVISALLPCFKTWQKSLFLTEGHSEMKVRSLLATSWDSRHTSRCCCFWSNVYQDEGTNFATMWWMFSFSLDDLLVDSMIDFSHVRKLIDCLVTPQMSLWIFFSTFFFCCCAFYWWLVTLNSHHLEQIHDRPWNSCVTHKPVFNLKSVC